MNRKRKMDPKLVSAEAHEVAYLARKLGVTRKIIRLARKSVGRSRSAVTAFVMGMRAQSVIGKELRKSGLPSNRLTVSRKIML